MLKNNFYSITSQDQQDQSSSTVINIHPEHEIFKGHFPEKPVVPGVCMIQIVKEILQQNLSANLLFQKGNQIKFLQLLVPEKEQNIEVSIHWKLVEAGFQTSADFKKEGAVIFKLTGIFIPA